MKDNVLQDHPLRSRMCSIWSFILTAFETLKVRVPVLIPRMMATTHRPRSLCHRLWSLQRQVERGAGAMGLGPSSRTDCQGLAVRPGRPVPAHLREQRQLYPLQQGLRSILRTGGPLPTCPKGTSRASTGSVPVLFDSHAGMVQIAEWLAQLRPLRRVGLLNPSDVQAVSQGKIGMFWYSGDVALEEILALSTTVLFQHVDLNPDLWKNPQRHVALEPLKIPLPFPRRA